MQQNIIFFLLIGVAVVFTGLELYDMYKGRGDADVTQSIDPNTFSNIDEVRALSWNLNIAIDFNATIISGNNKIVFKALINGVKAVNLDSKGLIVSKVTQVNNSTESELSFKVIKSSKLAFLGEKIAITLKTALALGDEITLRITYKTSKNAEALSWLTPEQTASKTAPYLFSQCEPISCRSIAPMQDTPAIKTPWEATVQVPANINVFLSANQTAIQTIAESKLVTFTSTMPMAFYVFAIVAGNVELQKVGKRTGVITEPTFIASYSKELGDLETYLSTVEDYIGAYRWGTYNIVILPPSFPFGGMENPLLTFASPTIIVGDKSGVFVAIHEIAHSWTGNLVTCVNWQNLWLNEGFTVFLERKASKKLFGTEFYKAEAFEGNVSYNDDLNSYGANSEYTKLHPVLVGLDPNNGANEVPYEKGFQLLTFIESLIGEASMQELLRGYVAKYALQSIDVYSFENYVIDFIRTNFPSTRNQILTKLDFDSWVELPGPSPIALEIDSIAVNQALTLAEAFVQGQGKSTPADASSLTSMVKVDQYIFIEQLIKLSSNVTEAVITQLESIYLFNESKDAEILQRWYTLTTKVNYQGNMNFIEKFVSKVGRIKMIVPLYTNIAKFNKSKAKQLYETNKGFYHPLAALEIVKIVGA